jgi:RHS repeat-associated protein
MTIDYTYDAVGNHLTQESIVNNLPSTVNYQYDDANRLSGVDSVSYAYDANGNLLNDGTNTYVFDAANRLISINGTTTYTYNGLGDRLSQTVGSQTTNYALDLNAGLTQVLDDGSNTYTYGLGRISQTDTTTEYFLGDALGSVRQLTDPAGDITLAKSYDPYGNVLSISGSGTSPFAFTGEQADASGLTYLRARYYDPADGRFMSRDTWIGDVKRPLSLNKWSYVQANPTNLADPSGLCSASGWSDTSGLFTQANCNALDNDLANGTASFTETWYRQLAIRERADGLPETAGALEYYLQGSGIERALSSSFTKNTVEVAMPKIKDKIDDLVQWYIDDKFSDLATCDSLNTGPDIYYGGKFTPSYTGAWFGSKQQEAAGTLGTFKIYVELSGVFDKIPVNSKKYTVNSLINVHVILFDFYDWNGGQSVIYPWTSNQIMDDWANNIEQFGNAKSYLNRGDYTYVDTKNGNRKPGWLFDPNKPPGDWIPVSCIGAGVDKDGDVGKRRKDYCGNQLP